MAYASRQLGFDDLLGAADAVNEAQTNARAYAHLPATMQEALPYLRRLIRDNHECMLANDFARARQVQAEAHHVAERLNGFEPGIIANGTSPGNVLERLTRARKGDVPLWGQRGSFELAVGGMRVRVAIEGVFGITSCFADWPGFHAHAVRRDQPFLSETGYRSFLGIHADLPPGQTPDTFAMAVIAEHVARRLKGRLVDLKPAYR